MCSILCHLIWGIWWFHRSKDFEAIKADKLAIWPWLSCQYIESTLMDEPCSRIIRPSVGPGELLLVPFGFLAKWAVRLFDTLWFNDLFDSVISLAKFVLVQGFRFLLKILLCFYSFICWSLAIILTCWHYISIDTDTDLIWPRKWMIHPARRKLPWL